MTTATSCGNRGLGLAVLLMTMSIGCGSADNPTAPGPVNGSDTTGSPVTVSSTVPAANDAVPGFYRNDLVRARSGTARVTLRWPDGDYSLQLYVTSGACLDVRTLIEGTCTVVGKTRPGDRPGVVASPVRSGDVNTIWVLNTDFAPQPFSVVTAIE